DNSDSDFNLPPGFRFNPTDQELLLHFLCRSRPNIIPDLAVFPYDPWDLPGKAMGEGGKWYFYSRKTRKRVTENGRWLVAGVDEPIYSGGRKIGHKKYWGFYRGETKTNWIMQEYGLCSDRSEWVVCKVYDAGGGDSDGEGGGAAELSCLDEVFLSIDDLEEDEIN
ncbi:hypothetical protein M569_05436, partial [Genlisea aurea]